MNSSEWSLLFFTLTGQFSVGITLALFILYWFNKKPNQIKSPIILHHGLITASLSIIIALFISFLHLSSPLSSVYALSNLKNSWLSWEIFMVSAYAMVIVLVTLYEWKVKHKSYITPLLLLSTLLGLTMIYSMGRLYMIETVPVWNTPETLIVFYINTIVLGLSFILAFYSDKIYDTVEKSFFIIILLTLILKLSTYYLNWETEINDNIAFTHHQIPAIWSVLWWLWIPGLVLMISIYLKKDSGIKTRSRLYRSAFILFVIAEFAARVIFYSSYYRLGV
ncbi:MAG TPA: DmsC/YnfH family molybdoenzyme membrane anchor subunit [Bacteroidales bacterium]|nr:DmsC/YnfH family molybdoenzyme membrane anchor subunit [Bacteroidales bacterium]